MLLLIGENFLISLLNDINIFVNKLSRMVVTLQKLAWYRYISASVEKKLVFKQPTRGCNGGGN